MIDAAESPLQEDVECKCYIDFDQPQLYTQKNLFMYRDGTQHATFNINGRTYIDDSTSMNITSGTTILFRQDYQDHPARVCMGIKSGKLQSWGHHLARWSDKFDERFSFVLAFASRLVNLKELFEDVLVIDWADLIISSN